MKLPHFVRYTDSVKAGDARAFYVRINPKYKNDKGIHAHEYEHVRQWYISLLIAFPVWLILFKLDSTVGSFFLPMIFAAMPLAYKTSSRLRYYLEVRAFKAQLAVYGYTPEFFEWAANALLNDYRLNTTKFEAMTKLRSR